MPLENKRRDVEGRDVWGEGQEVEWVTNGIIRKGHINVTRQV